MTTSTVDEFSERLFDAVLGAMDMWAIYLGETLGFYAALAARPMTTGELAAESENNLRYTREWLEQQSITGIVGVDDPSLPPDQRRYSLPKAHAEVLTDRDSLSYLAPFVRMMTASGVQIPALADAYREGGGVSWQQFGADMRSGQADMNRPWFLSALGTNWFPAVPDLDDRLKAGGRVADIGCGEGWSTLAIAKAYPNVTVDGFDLDTRSIERANDHADDLGLADRVHFHDVDAGSLDRDGEFDVVTAFECIHDLPYPVKVLATMRSLAKPDGHVVVMDEKVAEAFPGRGDDVERLMYGFSLFICLPDGMSHPDSAATGTVMRPETLEAYAREAGFEAVEILPIENDLWRFYRLK